MIRLSEPIPPSTPPSTGSTCGPSVRLNDVQTMIEVMNLCLPLDQAVSCKVHDHEGQSNMHLVVNPLGPDWITMCVTSVNVSNRGWSRQTAVPIGTVPVTIMGVFFLWTMEECRIMTEEINRLLSGTVECFYVTDPSTNHTTYRVTCPSMTECTLGHYSGSPMIYFLPTSFRDVLAPQLVPLPLDMYSLGTAYRERAVVYRERTAAYRERAAAYRERAVAYRDQSVPPTPTTDVAVGSPSLSELVSAICRFGGQGGTSFWLCHNRQGQIMCSVAHYCGQLHIFHSMVKSVFHTFPILLRFNDMEQVTEVVMALNRMFHGEIPHVLVHSDQEPDGLLKIMISRHHPYYDMVTSRWKPLRSRRMFRHPPVKQVTTLIDPIVPPTTTSSPTESPSSPTESPSSPTESPPSFLQKRSLVDDTIPLDDTIDTPVHVSKKRKITTVPVTVVTVPVTV